MFNTILIPLDGSKASERALAPAVRLARASHARLILVRAVWSPMQPGSDPVDAQREGTRAARTYLAGLAAPLIGEGLMVETRVPFDLAADGVLREIVHSGADLVVMASRRTRPDHRVYGSVAEAVLAQTHAPVMLMWVDESHFGVVEPLPAPQLLVPLDGSPFGETVLPYAAEMARRLGWSLNLLRVLPPRGQPGHGDSLLDEEAAAVSYLVGVAAPYRQAGLHVRTVVRRGLPVETILAESRHMNASLIAMATHGQTGVREMLFGSVTLAVLRQSERPLLLIRPLEVTTTAPLSDNLRIAEVTPSH